MDLCTKLSTFSTKNGKKVVGRGQKNRKCVWVKMTKKNFKRKIIDKSNVIKIDEMAGKDR